MNKRIVFIVLIIIFFSLSIYIANNKNTNSSVQDPQNEVELEDEIDDQPNEPTEPIKEEIDEDSEDEENEPESVIEYNLSRSFYEDIMYVSNPHDIEVLVNKNNALSSSFNPSGLVLIPEKYLSKPKEVFVRDFVLDAYLEMTQDLKDAGYRGILISSAYRSYSYQKELYDDYVYNNGKTKADTYSARPGHSEHQLGLAIDYVPVYDKKLGAVANSPEFQWIKEHAHEYGFIIRYTKAFEPITGYINEPWHIRYVGVDLASELYERNVSLEEYYGG